MIDYLDSNIKGLQFRLSITTLEKPSLAIALVQTLDEAIFISLGANTLRKCMNPNSLLSTIDE